MPDVNANSTVYMYSLQARGLAHANCQHRGVLPRQLLLEVLDSLQGIIFPLSEPKSRKLLQSLVAAERLDPDVLRWEFSAIRRRGEETVAYVYLADRLSELHSEL